MSQILHIFRKDARHHLPEILLSFALLVAFAFEQPRDWTGQAAEFRFLTVLLNFLPGFMVVSWVFLIVRLVQGESLVGDRQFWITRPYEWHKLLAAKLLSIIFFVHLPLFIAQLCLLKIAEFPVASSIPGLVFVHLLFATTIVMPSITLASITSGIGQAALVLLAVLLLVLGMAMLATTVFPESDLSNATDSLDGFLYVGACLTVILTQYLYRKALLSRLVLAGAVAVVFLIIAVTPYGRIITHDFPLPTRPHPLPAQFALDPSLSFSHQGPHQPNSFGEDVELEIPLQITDMAEKTIVQIPAMKLELDLPNGDHWTSRWRRLEASVSSGRTRVWPSLTMKKALFNKIKDTPVKAHLSLGFNVYQMGPATQFILAGDRLNIPGGARCLNDLSSNWLRCFAALKEPQPMFVVAQLPSDACPVSADVLNEPFAAFPASFSNLGSDSSPDLEFSPIRQFNLDLSRYLVFEDHEIRPPICPGTPLLFSKPKFLYSVRDELDLGQITLTNYNPTYPRKIVPPPQRLAPGVPSNSLSLNRAPRSLPGGPG